jgi:DNA invertase Pin-like site-specific DNA recombinase
VQFAKWGRSLIAQRVMSGKAEQGTVGKLNGSPISYGYALDWRIIEAEAQLVRRIIASTLKYVLLNLA